MRIIESQRYKIELREIAQHIKKDKKSASIKFVLELKKNVQNLTQFPYKYKKSVYFEDDNVRDMTYRSYTVTYEVFESKIEIMTIFNQNKPTKQCLLGGE